MFSASQISGDKPSQYQQLAAQARALLADETDRVANAANLAALLYQQMADVNWAGFYFYDGNELVVGPFQGLPACVRIPMGRGVCGTAASTGQTQVVDDVFSFEGHIACDAASRSECVVPLIKDGELIGVLDIDSPSPGRFDSDDAAGLQTLAQVFLDTL